MKFKNKDYKQIKVTVVILRTYNGNKRTEIN